MYLAISVVAAMCAFLAAVQTRNAKRLGADLRQKTVEAESFQLTARTMEKRLHAEEAARAQLADRITKVETALRESADTACRLRQELQIGRKAAKEMEERLRGEKVSNAQSADRCTRLEAALRESEVTGCSLRQELQTERESAEHWKEEFLKEQAYRLSTEGRIMREVNNLLRYDGTAHGQEDLSDE